MSESNIVLLHRQYVEKVRGELATEALNVEPRSPAEAARREATMAFWRYLASFHDNFLNYVKEINQTESK